MLKINNIKKTIESRLIIQNISFSLEKGTVLAILGESGSGKTTLLKLIAGLLEPDLGELLLNDEPIIPPSQKLIAGHPEIKLVRQDYGLFPNISLRENIAYELRFYEAAYRNERIDKLLHISKLAHIAHKLPREVSGGEQQRAVIARAIAEQPQVLLLDEPFSHLDISNKQRLKDEILNMVKEEQIACIFVTHEVSDAFGMADLLAVVQDGQITQYDTPEVVYSQTVSVYNADITGKNNILSGAWLKQYFADYSKLDDKDIVCIRPEKIKISNHLNTTNATILSSTFSGFYHEYLVEFATQKLIVYALEKYEIGAKVNLHIKDYHCFERQ